MMKSVQPVALPLMMMMMMMIMMGPVSAGPVPPSPNHSRHDDQDTGRPQGLEDKEKNSTSLEPRQIVNNTLHNSIGNKTLNSRMNDTDPHPDKINGYAAPANCPLSICALMNLGQNLQAGGDQLAGRSSSDPFGHGK